MSYRLASYAWGCLLAGCVVAICGRISKGTAVDTSLLSLLPASEGDALLTEANTLLSRRASHLLAFLAIDPDAAAAEDMGKHLKDELKQSEFVRGSLTELSPDQQKSFYDLYFPFRYQMLSPADRLRLQGGHALEFFMGRLMGSLYSPASAFLKDII